MRQTWGKDQTSVKDEIGGLEHGAKQNPYDESKCLDQYGINEKTTETLPVNIHPTFEGIPRKQERITSVSER